MAVGRQWVCLRCQCYPLAPFFSSLIHIQGPSNPTQFLLCPFLLPCVLPSPFFFLFFLWYFPLIILLPYLPFFFFVTSRPEGSQREFWKRAKPLCRELRKQIRREPNERRGPIPSVSHVPLAVFFRIKLLLPGSENRYPSRLLTFKHQGFWWSDPHDFVS